MSGSHTPVELVETQVRGQARWYRGESRPRDRTRHEERTPMAYPQVSHTRAGDGSESAGVPSSPSFPEIEEAVLRYWADDDTFRASVEQRDAGRDGDNEFVFYDGPPFANGLPHYGHLLTGYVKDLVPRYQTMRGRRVERRFGWGSPGAAAEVE